MEADPSRGARLDKSVSKGSANRTALQTSETGAIKLKADFHRIMLLSWVSNPNKGAPNEKDADSLHPDSSRAAGALRNNRNGRWRRPLAYVFSWRCRMSKIGM